MPFLNPNLVDNCKPTSLQALSIPSLLYIDEIWDWFPIALIGESDAPKHAFLEFHMQKLPARLLEDCGYIYSQGPKPSGNPADVQWVDIFKTNLYLLCKILER